MTNTKPKKQAARSKKKSTGKSPGKRKSARKWSGKVTKQSDALDLEPGVFQKNSPAAIARSLKRSALASRRRKAGPYQSAMSMLNFYINRGGKNLSERRKQILENAKNALRKEFDRAPASPAKKSGKGKD